MNEFRTSLGEQIFHARYALNRDETWSQRAKTIVKDVCGRQERPTSISCHPLLSRDELHDLEHFIAAMKFIPGGRYVYYAGRGAKFWSNCFAYIAQEDTREEWGRLVKAHSDALMTGGGVGCDYSIFRPYGEPLKRTGGVSSGPLPLMSSINEIGRNVRQGGARRSAIYGSLNWQHGDIERFLVVKDWDNQHLPNGMSYKDAKAIDFDFPAPLDGMNISVNWDDDWGFDPKNQIFVQNVKMAMCNGEPGFSFNTGEFSGETGRNACTEFTTKDDSDICNLGSVNMANIETLEEFQRIVYLSSKFLICGSIRAELPDQATLRTREKNRRIGLGLMGIHEWLLKRNYRYEINDELRSWLDIYKHQSMQGANDQCDRFYINRPTAYRAVAPTGTIGLLAGTTTGIESIYAVAYKRRWIENEDRKYKLVVDETARTIIEKSGIENPDDIETSVMLASDPERRIKFQADVQDYVDMAISSTLNLPAWGSELNNEDRVNDMAKIIAKYASRLRGLTFYPDGARGGQPITPIPYADAIGHEDTVFEEHSDQQCKSGVCGI